MSDSPDEKVLERPEPSMNQVGRRIKLGRRARKRRRKYLELEAAANAAIGKQQGDVANVSETTSTGDQGTAGAMTDLPPTTSSTSNNTSQRNGTASSDPSSVPTDRSYEQARVRAISQLTDADHKMLTLQLGYLPGNALEVVTRMKDIVGNENGASTTAIMDAAILEEPLVVKLYPLVLRDESDGKNSKRKRRRSNESDGKLPDQPSELVLEPFPTIFWVTHPRIKALVSKLELDRMGAEWEKILKEDLRKEGVNGNDYLSSTLTESTATSESAGLTSNDSSDSALAAMRKAHLAYSKERKDLLLPQDWEYIRQRRWEGAFDESRGVAGIRNPASVKCLHAHVSHYWSGCHDNVVGKWVAERVSKMLQESNSSCTLLPCVLQEMLETGSGVK